MTMLTTRFGDLNRLAELMRRDDPSLTDAWLEPDGKYQVRRRRLKELTGAAVSGLAPAFRTIPAEDFPTLYYGWGRCRVGSTALCNLFGVAGLPSYFQPVKAGLRNLLTGGPMIPWVLPRAGEQAHVFSKEVAGPYLMAECLFIPLQILIEAGYPPNRLHLIMLDRDPAASLASWYAKWSDRVPRARLLKHFIIASLNAVRVEGYARRHGVRVTHYVHEASRRPETAAAALFARLGLAERFSAKALTEWNGVEEFTSDRSSLIFTKEPDVYFVEGVHRSAHRYGFLERGRGPVTDEELDLIERLGVDDLYHAAAGACSHELGIALDAPSLPDPAMIDGMAGAAMPRPTA